MKAEKSVYSPATSLTPVAHSSWYEAPMLALHHLRSPFTQGEIAMEACFLAALHCWSGVAQSIWITGENQGRDPSPGV